MKDVTDEADPREPGMKDELTLQMKLTRENLE